MLRESPRWLFRRNRADQALAVLRLSRSEEQAELEMKEMAEHGAKAAANAAKASDSLLQRKYVVPFVIACVVAACTQATGINTIFSYAAKIMQGSGLSETGVVTSMNCITGINCVVTVIAVMLVDRLGRKALLSIGTAGIILSLCTVGILYNRFESKSAEVRIGSSLALCALSLGIGTKAEGARAARRKFDDTEQREKQWSCSGESALSADGLEI
jgi:hypothetical protein